MRAWHPGIASTVLSEDCRVQPPPCIVQYTTVPRLRCLVINVQNVCLRSLRRSPVCLSSVCGAWHEISEAGPEFRGPRRVLSPRSAGQTPRVRTTRAKTVRQSVRPYVVWKSACTLISVVSILNSKFHSLGCSANEARKYR
jgi:hypothetical protein